MNNMNQMNGYNQQNPSPESNDGSKFALNYQPNDILQKEFKNKMRGYDPVEVDQFLDGVIKDYETFSNELNRLKDENDGLKQQLSAGGNKPNTEQPRGLKNNMRSTMQPARPVASAKAENPSTNYDILRRISNLERRVFGHDFSKGVPNEEEHAGVKQFASAAVPNNNMNHDNMENGHNKINPNPMNNMGQGQMNNQNGFNGSPDHFQANRPNPNQGQNMNGFNKNMNNSGNYNQF
ncbi:cell division protein GpsB [Companilactobacillus tucceti DSM 20183]|uniref:Cell division protein GpsB n=1 Tax=Companilactobacillus tucceti DSM 20183 TaxID=1423811 RepID=A0A0R1J107_9LACO|nr:cell division protein GpsB [Companilactobacillus tucceti DSM 20183]